MRNGFAVEQIMSQCKNSKFPEESMCQKIHSIEDIARIAGVSKSTVSRSLNNSPLISEKTRNKIIEIARQHNFHINQAARSLNTKRSGVIALAMPIGAEKEYLISDPFIQRLLATLVHSLNSCGYDLLVVKLTENGDWINRYADSRRVDGFMILPWGDSSGYISMLTEREFPFVMIGQIIEGLNYVSADDYRGGSLAADHIAAGGAQCPAFIGGPENELEVVLRLQGYREGLQKNNLHITDEQIVYGPYLPAAGYTGMLELLDRNSTIDAVFACSDRIARGVLDALLERKKQIPDDITLVGYDNTIAQYTCPPLTTIHQDIESLGREAVRILVSQIDGGTIEQVVLPVELVPGGTSRHS